MLNGLRRLEIPLNGPSLEVKVLGKLKVYDRQPLSGRSPLREVVAYGGERFSQFENSKTLTKSLVCNVFIGNKGKLTL